MTRETKPPSVPTAKQGGDARARWPYAKPEVWTDRMLTALDKGVKGGKWFSLMDKVYPLKTLRLAWKQVRRNKGAAGVDRVSVELFERNAESRLQRLSEMLQDGSYRPQPVRRHFIPKPGTNKQRPLGIPTVVDRIVQTALRLVIEPIFEACFSDKSFGFRPERGCEGALNRTQELLEAGYCWVVDADIQAYFDTIDRVMLMEQIAEQVADGKVLRLLQLFLTQSVMEDCKEWTPVRGTPQGAVISPLLANIYLHPVDEAMQAAGYEIVRYADDLVVLCRSQQEAQAALDLLRQLMEQRKLTLHPEKTRLVDASVRGGFDFLGYHFERGYRWPRKKSMKALKDRVRSFTKRTSGTSLENTITRLNRVLRGWFGYFKASVANIFEALDGWVRMRLRSILRKRMGGRGHGYGESHRIWPDAYFRQRGLFFMTEAHRAYRQSLDRTH